jgi:uncharacterized membrane protein YgcG
MIRGWGGNLLRLLWLVAFLAAPQAARAEQPSQLQQQGYVNDFGDYISDDSRDRIGSICRELDRKTGFRLLIVTVKSTEGLTPGQFAGQLRNSWVGVTDVRERTMVFLVNGQGRFGGDIGDSIDPLLPHSKLDVFLKNSMAIGGNDYGLKLASFVEQVAKELESATPSAGSPPPPQPPAVAQAPAAGPSPSPRQASSQRHTTRSTDPMTRWFLLGAVLVVSLSLLRRGRVLQALMLIPWAIGAYLVFVPGGPSIWGVVILALCFLVAPIRVLMRERRIAPLLIVLAFYGVGYLAYQQTLADRWLSHVSDLSADAQNRVAIGVGVAVLFAGLLLLYGLVRMIVDRKNPNWRARGGRL